MLSLFSTSSDKAGFRLQYMEVYNWGTFNEKVFRINPQGNNSLLTGANASGKSTYIDALLTLIVPAKKDRFYNQSSGVEKKGDRTEETYVLGHYGNIQEEGKSSTSTQKLRDTNTYSVILASFSNTDQKQITLFQVRWFSNNELRRQFGIAHVPLEVEKDFRDFDAKGLWKRRLEKIYNANTTKKRIEFIDGPTMYAEKMSNLFGMRSVKALSLFNQIVGVKVLEDLDEFIRTNMLEEQDAETEFIQLKESFLTLMDAKTNIEKAKEQIKQLTPINDIANKLNKIQDDIQQLEKSKEIALYWFAQKGVELGEKELEKCQETLQLLEGKLVELRVKEDDLKQEERTISIAIEKDEVGSKIKDLEKEIKQLERLRDARKSKLEDYNKIAQIIKLNTNPDEITFSENRGKAKQLKQSTDQDIYEENENFRGLKNEEDRLKQDTEVLVKTIKTLQENKNNIAGREAEIRDEIIAHIGASKEEIPFIGELIKVKEDELNWESSIEKVLHNFALRLIVPPKYYSQVNQYVNSHNLKGRIRYDKYEEQDYLKNLRQKEINEKSLIHKIDIKPQIVYYEWIESYLEAQFDFICADNLSEFERHSQMSITQNGLVKFKRGKHEKDDRPHLSRKENYVLGWDNKEKIAVLRKELIDLQQQQSKNKKAISTKEIEIKNLGAFKDECHNLFSKFDKFDDVNWQFYANEIQEKTKQKEELETTNDQVKQLQEQLNKIQTNLKQLAEIDIKNKDREIFQTEEKQKHIRNTITANKAIFEPFENIDVTAFETQNLGLLHIEYANFETSRVNFQEKNSREIAELDRQKQQNEREISIKINTFKQPSEIITNKFKDWRSDVNSLPDSTHLEFIGEYQNFLERLEKDNLPKFEKKFNDYLQETITNKVGDFRMFFENWSDSIKENIRQLNDSLKQIDFKNSPKTYIQLVAPNKINDEVKEFRNLLNSAIPNIREVDASIDGRKIHFYNHIEPLISKLDKEDWRKKVMDVRSWFSYKAEEFYKETNQKFKTYEAMGQLSGGEKAQLTYTILGSAIAYQFGLTKEGLQSNSFRFIAIDEAFKAQDEDKSRYLITLCKQLHLQLLVVTPSDNMHIVENDISFVHFVERKEEKHSWLYDMPIEQFNEEKANYLNQ
ncbi:ATP-binding protein [Elizabethkingia anophelis]|uniref:ATP-binding protein n=1 Tax=Elizabethkingia anophelis TaxID=1117645 RepID=UPI0016250B91|nr:SbcC/MukB-like Walker B domain-containing protein [Elizabethkingia anophelis]MCT4322283.1 AAA family ATPase [Elizabethkingia anophelis]HAY3535347.1 AAA family ATPase [Elizabethkingia anophelis]HAY3537357.1 AAA family ATPase [Elizabethkingia anophelis]HAY3547463.1 AAA family ATPase [Elizabethkingia anophelis]HAY3549271.1 AAA family ATPase [Elizabethkingia anophelis]